MRSATVTRCIECMLQAALVGQQGESIAATLALWHVREHPHIAKCAVKPKLQAQLAQAIEGWG